MSLFVNRLLCLSLARLIVGPNLGLSLAHFLNKEHKHVFSGVELDLFKQLGSFIVLDCDP